MSVIIYVCIVLWLQYSSFGVEDICSKIKCSNIIDYVCGVAERSSIKVITTYQNICHLNRVKCKLKAIAHIRQVDDSLCNIEMKQAFPGSGRRLTDFSIVGAHQACNHTCPTYCVDTYEPACAQIWTTTESFKYRPMINHCHIDLLSCAAGVNVTIMPLVKCYTNPSRLMFMSQIAAMKSLKLLDEPQQEHTQFTVTRIRRKRGVMKKD